MTLTVLQCPAPSRRALLPQLPLVAEMPRRMVPSGDAEHSMRARALLYARLHPGCCSPALPTSEKKHCMQMVCRAPQAK